ncbi:MAG: hypothetical protein A2Z99_08600 [Treponema sp. GWB1_62_6]|nr:MAG: hypothetical protein A2001_13205 [Treponema sp. GWC1_61_84]OHE69904.1 MAG: hypothetical protein A2Z99_08600 [Treponema sp. GWB1_62_6]OHE72829.1 MAG: hypothetical protein A2413_02335 [Treponema sp. RIFOXYC1_FULL_61_9]HCM27826.1 hypothetical protein [Treponema sp.]
MGTHPYTEDRLMEQPAIALLIQLGRETVSAIDEAFGEGGHPGAVDAGERGPARPAHGRTGAV